MSSIAKTTLFILSSFFVISFILVLIKELIRPSKKEYLGFSNLWLRYISWLVIAPLFLIPAYFGSPYFNILIMIIAAFCLKEYFKLTKVWELNVYKWAGRLFSLFLLLITLSEFITGKLFYILPIFVIMTILITPVFLRKPEKAVNQVSITVVGILYFGWLFSHIILLRNRFGFGAVVFLCSLVVLTDVMAYTIGKLFGRHKLIPQISPNKTMEGAVGGALGAIFGSFIFGYALPEFSARICLYLGFVIGITSQLGDLVISVIKRDAKVKDSGYVIPGHGGVLDRCDSLIFSIPFMYYLLIIF